MLKWVAVFVLLWFIHHVRSVFPPFIVGAIIAYLLLPLVKWIASTLKMKKAQAVAVVYVALAVLWVVLGWKFGRLLMEQCNALAEQRSEIIAKLITQLNSPPFNLGLNANEVVPQLVSNLESFIARPSGIAHSVGLVSHWLLSLLVCTVSSIYFVIDSDKVGDFLLRFIPHKRHGVVKYLSEEMNVMLARYVQGQLYLIAIMSLLAWAFLHFVVHLKYALAVALLSGFLEIIPVLGPIVATTTATVIGFFSTGNPMLAVGIICFYTIARWLEDYFVVPRIIGHAVHLHPLIVIFAVLCGDVMAGALGMLIAIPMAASIKVVIDYIYPPLKDDSTAVIEGVEKQKEKGNGISLADLRELPEATQLLVAYFLEDNSQRITLLSRDGDAEPLKARGWLKEVSSPIIGIREYKIAEDVWQQQKALADNFITKEMRRKLDDYKQGKSAQYPWKW